MSPPNLPAAIDAPVNVRSRVWWIIVAAFALQLAAWATWLIIASHHRVAEVPLATKVAK